MKSVYKEIEKQIIPKDYVMISPMIEKDNRTYTRIGELEDGREIYKRIKFVDSGRGQIKEETLLIETINIKDID